ncbi:MAG: penicillin-binding protein 2 [Patescibacteria group bacterium]
MQKFNFLSRIKFLRFGFILFFLILITQLYMVQIIKGEEYEQKATNQYVKPQYIFNRGNIFFEDKNGKRISAGMNRSGFKVTINPDLIKEKDAENVYQQLSKIIKIDKDTFLYRAGKENDSYEEVLGKIDSETAKKIEDLDLSGVNIEMDKWRFYPGNELASHLLGFVGYNENSFEGIYGVENYYDYLLQRKSKNLFVNFFAEIFLDLNNVISNDEVEKEGDIILTIDPSVQTYLETKLEELSEKWKTDLAGGVIINPNNGEIYALGLHPDFNLNDFQNAKNISFGNPIVENVYEMGSIMKALTVAIGLDMGVITADTIYNDKGSLILNGKTISNFDGKARGLIKVQEILNQSLNVGAVFTEQKIGNEKFAEYLLNLGFGEETGIDLPNETFGLISNLKSARDIEYATISYGHGIAVTPIGMVKALSSLANGGVLITPHLVKEIKYGIMSSDNIFYENKTRIFKEETSKEISRMLTVTVDEALLNGAIKSDNYTIAAKTGTAQIAKENGRGYYDDKCLHSFFGYFPATKPEFLVFLYIVDPKNAGYSSGTLTYPFADIFKFLVNYYEISPDRMENKI